MPLSRKKELFEFKIKLRKANITATRKWSNYLCQSKYRKSKISEGEVLAMTSRSSQRKVMGSISDTYADH